MAVKRQTRLSNFVGIPEGEQTLTLLSFGAGQDSTAILLKLIHDADFRTKYAPQDLIVVFSDTGDEHDETYAHLDTRRLLQY